MVDAGDAELVAFLDPEALVRAVEPHDIACHVVPGERLLGVGIATRGEALGLQCGAVDDAVAGQTLADDPVDPLAQAVARRHQPGALARLGRKREPARGGRAREIVRVHLGHVVAELLEGTGDIAGEARFDGFLQRRIALAHDLVHHGGLHAGGLELREGLAGIDRVELFLVAHQHHAGDAQAVDDPQEVAGLDGGGERALVDNEHRLRERRAHFLLALGGHPPRRDPCVAREETLQGLGADPGLAFEGARGRAEGASPRTS